MNWTDLSWAAFLDTIHFIYLLFMVIEAHLRLKFSKERKQNITSNFYGRRYLLHCIVPRTFNCLIPSALA